MAKELLESKNDKKPTMTRDEYLHELKSLAQIEMVLNRKERSLGECVNRICKKRKRLVQRGWILIDLVVKYLPEGEL